MRLPENKKARQKMLALAGLLVAAAAYGVWVAVYEPLRSGRDEARSRTEELEMELRTARALIRRTGDQQRELEETTRELLESSERHMLHPRLGNYLLQAREILARHGQAAGVEGIQVVEVGLVELPKSAKQGGRAPAVRAYSARALAECGLDALEAWIGALERENPLVAISHLTVAAQAANPEAHLVRFEVQWPVWIEPGMRETVAGKAAEVLGGKGK